MRGVRAGLLVGALAALWLTFLVLAVPTGQAPLRSWTTVFDQHQTRAERVINQMDGQAFAQQAADPTMSDLTSAYRGDQQMAAYRSARPLQGWVNWLASLGGQRALIAPAMLLLGVIAIGFLPIALQSVADALGREVWRPELVVLAPACLAYLRWPGLCDPLAAAIVLFGLAAWFRSEQRLAIGLFCLAALTRETSLLVPLGLGLATLWRDRRLRPALPLATPALVYAAWAAVVRLRVGVFPSGSAQMGLPLQGLVEAVPYWTIGEVVTFAALAGALAVIWWRGTVEFRCLVVAHAAFLAFLGPVVWRYWWAFGRVTLPIFVLALIGASREVKVASAPELLRSSTSC